MLLFQHNSQSKRNPIWWYWSELCQADTSNWKEEMKFGSHGLFREVNRLKRALPIGTGNTPNHPHVPTTTLQESKILFSTQTLFHHTNHIFCFSRTFNFWACPQGLAVSLWEDTAQSICSTKLSAAPSREKCGTVPQPDGCQLALLGVFQLHCNPYFSINYSPSICRHTQSNVILHWSELF